MGVSVTLPRMGESVTEGTIIRWLKAEGEWVNEDEPIVEISTDKIDTEMPAPASGVLSRIVVGPDTTVEVGTEIAVIEPDAQASGDGGAPTAEGKTDEAPSRAEETPKPSPEGSPKATPEATPDGASETAGAAEPAPKAQAEAKPAAPKRPASPPPPQAEPQPQDGRARGATSPLVRKLARERGVDLSDVPGTGPGGRVTKDDVLAAASGKSAAPGEQGRSPAAAEAPRAQRPAATSQYRVPTGPSEDVPFTRVRKAIADHMVRSLQIAAQLTNVVEVDMTRVAQLRARAKAEFERTEQFGLTFLPFVAAAAVQALRTFPEFNAHILDDGATARLYRQVNLGIAVGREEGLIVPIVHAADGMNLIGLARGITDVAERARAKGLTPDDVAGGTFTITNYGSAGGLMDTPIINQPQVGILGVGTIQKRPAVISVDGADAIAIRQMMFLSLSYDHRWIDGQRAAQFNSRIKHILEEADFAHELGLS